MIFKATSVLLVGTLFAGANAQSRKSGLGTPLPTGTMAKNLYEMARDGDPFPNCGDLGQNEPFQGAQPLYDSRKKECVKVNICHGNAGFGWNRITVDRDAIGIDNNGHNGHANFEHNDPSNNKREDFFPNTYSVPNPSGAGINGYLDGNCGFVPYTTEAPPATTTTAAPPAATTEAPPAATTEAPPGEPEKRTAVIPEPKTPATGHGDPHFKTWTGEKFDYHGECDLVLVDNPSFADGLGLRVHIRTTRQSYFSYIDLIAVQIGDDVLEFDNDVSKFLINGEVVKAPYNTIGKNKYVTVFGNGSFKVKRALKAISIRLDEESKAKIDLIQRAIGFPAIVLDGADTKIFEGSLGLLGDFTTGKKIARDGQLEIQDATEFALEWQVRDTEPMLFSNARFPQYPTVCTPPKKIMGNRLGMSLMKKEAEKVCAKWNEEDRDECIFDVIATRDVMAASEGSAVA